MPVQPDLWEALLFIPMLELQGPGTWCFYYGIHPDLPGPRGDLSPSREVGNSALLNCFCFQSMGPGCLSGVCWERAGLSGSCWSRGPESLSQMQTVPPLCHFAFFRLCVWVVCWEGAVRQASWRKHPSSMSGNGGGETDLHRGPHGP